MSSNNHTNGRKRKPTNIPEAVSSTDDQNYKERKARRVSTTNASASTAVAPQVDTPVATENATAANAVSAATEDDEVIQRIGALIQDLFCADNAKVNASLDALLLDLEKDKKKRQSLVTTGGCFALVHLMQNCLDKATDRIPECDQVTELNKLAELKTLSKTLNVINNLAFLHEESIVGITAVGGVEAVVKAMKIFPKCQPLQERACGALRNLACCSIGATKAIRSGGIEILLAAVTNHLDSAKVCERVCWALFNIVHGSKENIGLLITLKCGAAVEKVRMKWLDNNDVQTQVRKLAKLFVTAWKARGDAEE
jgi:hypothetical protein